VCVCVCVCVCVTSSHAEFVQILFILNHNQCEESDIHEPQSQNHTHTAAVLVYIANVALHDDCKTVRSV